MYVTTHSASGCTGEAGSRGAAGAVAAACRELRPIEIVGIYETQREAAEVRFWMLGGSLHVPDVSDPST